MTRTHKNKLKRCGLRIRKIRKLWSTHTQVYELRFTNYEIQKSFDEGKAKSVTDVLCAARRTAGCAADAAGANS